ncbi:hypothetical protein AVEN_62131-1 [Araneus ventricosus]|uniref:Uncharacterized protein n=1 Tax=Araneus ventricosus TaxID=182803 RepID=A0A4Y2U1T1_ARAVE|nr:hypothetical protein AVEN_157614-1 [Araneus ventricosus]GBO06499.1 hypothetical protein AVEN_62131-1 [Araneus ventricosus]
MDLPLVAFQKSKRKHLRLPGWYSEKTSLLFFPSTVALEQFLLILDGVQRSYPSLVTRRSSLPDTKNTVKGILRNLQLQISLQDLEFRRIPFSLRFQRMQRENV